MLVLSRREDQKILFPNLGITVEVVGIQGSKVRLGVEAPPQVRIIRDELADDWDFAERESKSSSSDIDATDLRHKLANRLNSISLKLQLVERLHANGSHKKASVYLRHALNELAEMDESVASQNNEKIREQDHPNTTNGIRPRALLVEDNDNERQLLSTILDMSGIEVHCVANGAEALDYLQEYDSPDFLLIDMQMPRLTGPQTIAIIRQNPAFNDLPIYGVTGLQRSETNIPLGKDGVDGWFTKPVQADSLLDELYGKLGIDNQTSCHLN